MERMNVNPTRMMLTSLKKRLKTAVRGHKLLEDKRDELMKEFLELARENGRLRQEVEKALDRVYKNFTIAAAIMSQEVMEESLMYPKQGVELSVGSKNIMSVDVPVFEFQTTAKDTGDITGLPAPAETWTKPWRIFRTCSPCCWIWPPRRRRHPCWQRNWKRPVGVSTRWST